jgi:hypothetical protein
LDGRRSKDAYMPDIVAIYGTTKTEKTPIVMVIETKDSFNQSDGDIKKLLNFSNTHAAWVAFRLQNHLSRGEWERKWRDCLQRVILVGSGLSKMPVEFNELELIFVEYDYANSAIKKVVYGKRSPLKQRGIRLQ